MDYAILAEGLGKQYFIGKQQRYRTLRESLTEMAFSPFRRIGSLLRGQATGAADLHESFWALRDVSFSIPQGAVVGIIGRNGAGKSTLLKVLSRITEPTTGVARIRGRVGSLLEVGTGFHPELTGRENIFLNGAILGMHKSEIIAKFDEIVGFAELERFVDTPVKHYSSGMYLRLAFAVAAHLEPEILLVDEVLAVGDAAFQKKCLGKMGEVAGQGRTVLLVSHNLGAISHLCPTTLMLEGGRLEAYGPTDEVVSSYMARISNQLTQPLGERRDRRGKGPMRFESLRLLLPDGSPAGSLRSGEAAVFEIGFRSVNGEPLTKVMIQIHITDPIGNLLFTLSTHFTELEKFDELPNAGRVFCQVPSLPLAAGLYTVALGCEVNGHFSDNIKDAFQFTLVDGNFFGNGNSAVAQRHGSFLVKHGWSSSPPEEV